MYCGQCGSKNLDGAEYCANCGAKLSPAPASSGRVPEAAAQAVPSGTGPLGGGIKGKTLRNIVIAVCVVVVAIIIAAAFMGGRNVKTTVDKMITATFEADAQGIIDLVPDKVMDELLQEEGYDREYLDDFIAEGANELQTQLNILALNVGSPMETKHTFTEEDKTKEEIEELNDEYEELGVKISGAKLVRVEITVSGPVRENTSEMNLPLIKVGKSWYVDALSMGSFF